MEPNTEAIQAFGTQFRYSKARDFEVIIDSNDYINYSKLLESITGNRKKLLQLCEWNGEIFTLIYDYEKEKIDAYLHKQEKSEVSRNLDTSENDEILSLPKTMTVTQLVEANIFVVYNGANSKANRICSGTYGPRYLLDILIILSDVSYYKLIHDTLESIDAYAIENNKSFTGELERLKEDYEEKRKRLAILIKEKDVALKHSKYKNKSLEQKLDVVIKQNRKLKDRCDNLISMNLQSDGKLDEANAKIDELLCYAEARDKDSSLFKQKMNMLNNKVSKLNASNFDDEGSIVFIWYLFRSDSLVLDYTKSIPENAIWIYSQIREDKNKSIPDDAEILFEANVVSRSMYESLMKELEFLIIDKYYRHILISYENATAFIDKLNEFVLARGIHPETYNIEALNNEIETIKAKNEIRHKRETERAKQIAIRQRIIDEGKFYIYIFGRWRRLYNKIDESLTTELDASKFFYVRTGAGGINSEHIQTKTLVQSRFRAYGDARIRYEN